MPGRAPASTRGGRPRNRRALILAAAAQLFIERGYRRVAMSDLAGAVGIGPSALYRHFSGKEAVLTTVIEDELRRARAAVVELDPADVGASTRALAAQALEQRHLGLLWQREARNLGPESRRRLRVLVGAIASGIATFVRTTRPDLDRRTADLLGLSVIAVLTSLSFHHFELPRPEYERLLAELVTVVLGTDVRLPHPVPVDRPRPRLVPAARREVLLDKAIRMFADHGYDQVGIEDIGNAVGIAGPSVYNHWPTKLDLLLTALQRGAAVLAVDVASTYRLAATPAEALELLARSHIARSRTHPEVFGLLITDLDNLPDEERAAVHRAQQDYLGEWTHLLLLDRPDLDPVAARIRVHAALALAHATARTQRPRRDPAVATAVETLYLRILTGH
ncbi:MAG TPA: TetR/AcrR family transcriptional regulator [Amycolatopsis sp.]|nr:TetR/AcrR family transcriptional regulator [Amycolatopsis sp.]